MSIDVQKVADDIFMFDMFDMFSIEDVIWVLQAADNRYFNDDNSHTGVSISDEQYDSLRLYASKNSPEHKYFTGVGTDVRGGKIKLPYTMGSLDQVHIGEIADWVGKWRLHQQYLIATDKLDGTSAMIVYDDNGELQIAYSRGNGIEGADITRHIKHLVPNNIREPAVIRGEVIISKNNFDKARDVASARSGHGYKNARNMVAGIMNSKAADPDVYQYISFIAYEIIKYDGVDKINMLSDIEQMGFYVPIWKSFQGHELSDSMLADYLTERRDLTAYEIDGIVIDVNLSAKRDEMNPSRDTLNPAYSVKYKVADADNLVEAKVVAVHWAASKHGYLKPRIEVEPFDLQGVTITYCTGFNAKFILENNIGPGAIIQVTRSGDVIPFCQKVISGTTASMPTEKYTWSDEAVDAILINLESDKDVQINRLTDFFSSIDAPLLKKGSITKLYNVGYTSIESIISATEENLLAVIGSNGAKIYRGLKKALTDIPMYKLLGAHSNERGIGVRRMKKLQEALGRDALYTCNDASVIADQDGFNEKTAEQTVRAISQFQDFLFDIDGFYSIAAEKDTSDGPLAGKKICFTGFRDKALQGDIEDAGGTMQSSVSSKTDIVVTTDPNGTSGKLKKARDLGKLIVSVDEIKGMLE